MRAAVVLATTATLVLAPALPAVAGERMRLDCGGVTIERTNGHSWWGVDHDAVHTAERLVVGGTVVHESRGARGPGAERWTCTADHHGTTWVVDLVRAR